jgi:RNA polymerase sigma-70 factor (sigma-E family)
MTTLLAGAVREAAHADRGPEPEDFQQYVARRHLALLRTAYLLTGDHASAEDLVQTALARTWLAWGRIEDPRAVDAYVRRTLVNTHRSAWRRRRVKEVPTDVLPETLDDAAPAEDDGLRDVLWAALAQLPRQQRVTLVLRYYEDLSEAETARVLGVSVGTVKSNASRGLARLREHAASARSAVGAPVGGTTGQDRGAVRRDGSRHHVGAETTCAPGLSAARPGRRGAVAHRAPGGPCREGRVERRRAQRPDPPSPA